jgi:hypothetical protein
MVTCKDVENEMRKSSFFKRALYAYNSYKVYWVSHVSNLLCS